jgi:hypothetical protein
MDDGVAVKKSQACAFFTRVPPFASIMSRKIIGIIIIHDCFLAGQRLAHIVRNTISKDRECDMPAAWPI